MFLGGIEMSHCVLSKNSALRTCTKVVSNVDIAKNKKKNSFFIIFWQKLYFSCLELGIMMDKVVTNILTGKTTNKNAARQRDAIATFCDIYIICAFYRGL